MHYLLNNRDTKKEKKEKKKERDREFNSAPHGPSNQYDKAILPILLPYVYLIHVYQTREGVFH